MLHWIIRSIRVKTVVQVVIPDVIEIRPKSLHEIYIERGTGKFSTILVLVQLQIQSKCALLYINGIVRVWPVQI